jgi:GTP-dependent phosphoenolpyruvate carboxykinase
LDFWFENLPSGNPGQEATSPEATFESCHKSDIRKTHFTITVFFPLMAAKDEAGYLKTKADATKKSVPSIFSLNFFHKVSDEFVQCSTKEVSI